MALIEDINNKLGQHVTKNEYWQTIGEQVLRCKLPYGDYILPPLIVVDTKRNIEELAFDIQCDHARFKKAAIKARDMGSTMWILTENTDGVRNLADLAEWRESDKRFEMRKAKSKNVNAKRHEGKTLAKACVTMGKRYGLVFDFCTPEESGARVLDILRGGRLASHVNA